MKPRKPLNKISRAPHRREKRFVPVSVLKEVKKRSGGQCEFWSMNLTNEVLYRCQHPAMPQPHHKLKRSQGGKHTLENLMDCCFYHHMWIENNPKEAAKMGYHIPYKGYTP